jgi:hypothetical protein
VPAADDLSAMDDDRPDGNAAFGQTLPGLVDGGLHEFVHDLASKHDSGTILPVRRLPRL